MKRSRSGTIAAGTGRELDLALKFENRAKIIPV